MYFNKTRKKLFVRSFFISTALFTISSASVSASNASIITPAPSSLQLLIQQVVPTHSRFLAAQAKRDSVKESLNAADNAIYNPELELDSEKTDIKTTTIGLSQTIDWGDQRGAKRLIAENRLLAAEAIFQQERQRLASDLLYTAKDFYNKKRLAVVSEQRLSSMQEFVKLAKQKHAAGDLNQVELNLAQLAYSEAVLSNALISSDSIYAEQAYLSLFTSHNKNIDDVLDNISIDFQKIHLPIDLESFLLTLPQMKVLRAGVAASKSNIALRESESSADPTISIRGGKEDKESLVGISLSIPLNIRNNYSAEINVARQEYLQAEQLAQQAHRDLIKDITSQTKLYLQLRNAWNQWQQSGQKSMNRQLTLLKQLWRSGDLSTTDYLVQIKQNLDTQSAGINLETKLWSSWLTWLDTTANIESWLQLQVRN